MFGKSRDGNTSPAHRSKEMNLNGMVQPFLPCLAVELVSKLNLLKAALAMIPAPWSLRSSSLQPKMEVEKWN